MLLGEVVGRVWADRQVEGLDGHRMVLVRDIANGHTLVSVDLVGVSAGNRVLVATDDAAQSMFEGGAPIDAVVVALVAGVDEEPSRPERSGSSKKKS